MDDAIRFEKVERPLSEAELGVMKDQLVVLLGELETLRDEKQQASETLSSKIKRLERELSDLQRNISRRFEMIEVEVFEFLNDPEPGQKRVVRVDINKTLRTVPMTPRERQQSFNFEPKAEGSEGE